LLGWGRTGKLEVFPPILKFSMVLKEESYSYNCVDMSSTYLQNCYMEDFLPCIYIFWIGIELVALQIKWQDICDESKRFVIGSLSWLNDPSNTSKFYPIRNRREVKRKQMLSRLFRVLQLVYGSGIYWSSIRERLLFSV